MSDTQPIRSAIQECIDYRLEEFGIDAPSGVFAAESKRCQDLGEALTGGKPLNEDEVRYVLTIASFYIDRLTYQCVPPHAEPSLPLLDLPGRVRSATSVLEALEPLLADHAAYWDAWKAIEQAKRLRFRWSYGEPLDYEILRAERELNKGTVVRAPVARSLSVPFGPTSWDESMGPARPGRIFVRLGQTDPATTLLLIEQDRPHAARSIRVFSLHRGGKELLHEIDDQTLWYCEGLERRLADEELRGVHFSLWTPRSMSSVYLADLGSPLGLFVQVPSRHNCGEAAPAQEGRA